MVNLCPEEAIGKSPVFTGLGGCSGGLMVRTLAWEVERSDIKSRSSHYKDFRSGTLCCYAFHPALGKVRGKLDLPRCECYIEP